RQGHRESRRVAAGFRHRRPDGCGAPRGGRALSVAAKPGTAAAAACGDAPQAGPHRCGWCTSDPLYIAYPDSEWAVPSHDDRHLFEMLVLEGAQAGLSWITILRKRENYRRAF